MSMHLPVFSGNWVDLVIIIFIGIYIWEGWRRGFISEFIDLFAFAGAFLIALKWYGIPAKTLITYLGLSQGIANIFSFIALGFIVEQLFSYIGELVEEHIPVRFFRSFSNKLAGIVPLIVNAFIVVTFVIIVLLGLPVRRDIKAALSESFIARSIITRTQEAEKRLSLLFGEAVSDTINFLTIAPYSHEAIPLHFRQEDLSIDQASEAKMLERVNVERTLQGLSPLMVNDKLRDLARVYAKDLFSRGYFSHYNPEGQSPFDRMRAAEIHYNAAGENLALAPSVGIAHQGLMSSSSHRANILSTQFKKIGIGVIDGGIYGKMFVQEFTD